MHAVCSMDEKYLGLIPDGTACTHSAAAGWEGLEFADSMALPTQFICFGTRDHILSEGTAATPETL